VRHNDFASEFLQIDVGTIIGVTRACPSFGVARESKVANVRKRPQVWKPTEKAIS
jgi:hypothetical protein